MSMTRTPVSRVSRQQSNPFDSDSEIEENYGPARAFSAPPISMGSSKVSPFTSTEDGGSGTLGAAKHRYKNEFRDAGGLEHQPLQEVENYVVYRAEETTQKLNDCLRIAEEMREDASRTLVNLHQQGERIQRTHLTATNMDYDLSMGEKLLGSLGGFFSKTWKPVKGQQIKGPALTRDDSSFLRGSNHLEQRQKLGLSAPPKVQSNPRQYPSESTTTLQKVEVEKAKQDDTLNCLSGLLDQMKEMAADMGSEIDRQNKGLNHLRDDVDTLNDRVKGANRRARRLLGK